MDAEATRLVELARAWLVAFNAHDLEALLALYDEKAVHTSPKLRTTDPTTKGEIRGKAALRAWWEDAMRRLPELRYEPRHLTAGAGPNGRVIMEYDRVLPGEPTMPVAEVLVCERGQIVSSHVFHG